MPTWGRGGRAVGGDGRVWAARGARPPAPPVHGAGGASVGSCEVRRWVRHSVRCWSHATEGSQTRHVAGSWSQQRLLRASASRTDASRSSCWWPRLSVALGAPGCGPHGVGTRARGRRPSAEHPGDHVRAEGAAGDGRRAAPWAPVGPQLRARLRDEERGRRRRKFLKGGEKIGYQEVTQVGALRGSRGLLGCRCDSHGSRRGPAPVQRVPP